jgi:predicted secreted protein
MIATAIDISANTMCQYPSLLLITLAGTGSKLLYYGGKMKKSAAGSSVAPKTTSDRGVASTPPKLRVGREIVDTTWRMTVPVVIFTFIGIFTDLRLDTTPWVTFLGVIVGFYFAVILIKQQIKRSEDT